MKANTAAILGGLALGFLIGTQMTPTLNQYPPFSFIATYFSNLITSGQTAAVIPTGSTPS